MVRVSDAPAVLPTPTLSTAVPRSASSWRGTLREDCPVDGVVSDSWVFGLLRREWDPS